MATFEQRMVESEAKRLAVAVRAFEGRARYAVTDALRATAQAAARDVRIELRKRFDLKVKEVKGIRAYRRRGRARTDVYFTAFFGYRKKLSRPKDRITANEWATLRTDPRWFEVERTAGSRGPAHMYRYVWRRVGASRTPIKAYRLDLSPIAPPLLSEAAMRHWRTTFPRRLRDRLRAQQSKSKTLGQWLSLERATKLAQRTIDRIGEVPDARAG